MELEVQALGDVVVGALLEGQPDVQPDSLSAGLGRTAIGRFHDAGPSARRDNEPIELKRQREAPTRQTARHFTCVLVVFRPFDVPPRSSELGLILRVGVADAARAQRLERTLGALARIDASRTKEHDGVLNLLGLEAPQRLEIFGQDAKRPSVFTLEKLRVQVRQRLLRHNRHFITGV